MYHSLLVPLDGSAFAEQALPLALEVARRAGAPLHLVSVVRPLPAALRVSGPKALHPAPAWHAYLDGVVERLRGPVSVSCSLLEGKKVADLVRDHARAVEADLVVMATHGRGALGRFWLGSTAYDLLDCLPMPILMVRPGAAANPWETDIVLRHVLIALDGSPAAEGILEPAIALGSLMGADFTLLRVAEDVLRGGNPVLDPVSLSSPALELLDEIRIVQEQVCKQAESYLEALAGRLRARGLVVQTRLLVADDPAAAIVREGAPPAFDLLALEAHGEDGVPHRSLGRVARKVLHAASTPVLVQPTPGRALARQSAHLP